MAVYLGNAGLVSLQRTGGTSYASILDVADVNVAQKRFSFDFPNATFITGDYLQLTRSDGGDLDFIAADGFTPSGQAPTGAWYVSVDSLGGIRLYKTFADSLTGSIDNAITLEEPSTSYEIVAELGPTGYRNFGQISSYELSTERAALDVTTLGEEFVSQVSGLISGSGSMSCFWDFEATDALEVSQYIHQLILRQKLGSTFSAGLTIKRSGASSASSGPGSRDNTQLYYLVSGIITNVGISFEASDALQSQIEFVTTGEIKIRYSQGSTVVGDLLLQEDGGALDLESGTGSLLQEEG
jgi:hypothetical protein